MKRSIVALLLLVAVFLFASSVSADTWVNGYFRSDGTYVNGHYRSDPDGYHWNNYSSYGNTNPYTGARGYTMPSYDYSTSYYSSRYSSYGLGFTSSYYKTYDWDW